MPSFIVHGSQPASRVMGRKEERGGRGGGLEEDLLPAHPILCQSSLAQVQVCSARCPMLACSSSFLPFTIAIWIIIPSPADKSEPNECQRVSASILCPSLRSSVPRLRAYSPSLYRSSSGIRSLPENSSFVTVGQFNVTLASPTLSPSSILDLRQGRRRKRNEK